MTTAQTPEQMLREFHESKAIHGGLIPEFPTADIPGWVKRVRGDLLHEEINELGEAVESGDIVKIADALGDIVYVAVGTAVAYGIPFDAVLAEVHRSNMTKDNSPAEGKLVKGPGYEAPRIAEVLGADHVVVSLYGWNCDVCGRPVDGRTDERGTSARQDELAVHHIRHDDSEERAEAAWLAHHGE